MKKVIAIVLCLSSISSAFAGDVWASLGKSSKSEGNGTSASIGYKGESNFGFQLGGVFNSDFTNSDVLDYPVPHSNYTSLGTKRTGNTLGIDVLYFVSSTEGLRPYVGLGIYLSDRKEIAQSNATGWYYNQGSSSNIMATGELGLQYKTSSGLLLGLGYHSLRGANFSIGKSN